MIVCIVLIWFLLTFIQESGNLDAIFKVQSFWIFLTLPLGKQADKYSL